jgi:hypothetical protein
MDRRRSRVVDIRSLILVGVLAGSGQAVNAQVAQPRIADNEQRSGLLTRNIPFPNVLPPDPKRDTFYGTHWGDSPVRKYPNNPLTSGLYGQRYQPDCTACFSPSFRGAPGVNSVGPNCQRGPKMARFVTNIFHQFKPVGHYYSGGCFTPIYDLDPLVPGPGPFPYPFFISRPIGG